MNDHQDMLCFQCGQTVGDPPVLNYVGEDEDEPCQACADRVLAAQPGIFPSYVYPMMERAEQAALEDDEVEFEVEEAGQPANIRPVDDYPEPA